ncbi:T-cell surface glycoprotein CD3 delta chain isoform 2 [Camelus ferus]|nr:T-cell surface glycoprotein CD3 delta chain isoform 2 [Camelus ferus]
MQDPRGVYRCNTTDKQTDKETTLQVYFRMCQNCVELDSATLAGIIITDIIATLLLAVGVYCFAGHETGRVSGAADTQALLRNDQLYQPLRGHSDAQYSRLVECVLWETEKEALPHPPLLLQHPSPHSERSPHPGR